MVATPQQRRDQKQQNRLAWRAKINRGGGRGRRTHARTQRHREARVCCTQSQVLLPVGCRAYCDGGGERKGSRKRRAATKTAQNGPASKARALSTHWTKADTRQPATNSVQSSRWRTWRQHNRGREQRHHSRWHGLGYMAQTRPSEVKWRVSTAPARLRCARESGVLRWQSTGERDDVLLRHGIELVSTI